MNKIRPIKGKKNDRIFKPVLGLSGSSDILVPVAQPQWGQITASLMISFPQCEQYFIVFSPCSIIVVLTDGD